ncbi:XdhC family protein, partial [Rhizobium sp. BR 317]
MIEVTDLSLATAASDVDVIVSEPGNAGRNIVGNIDGYSTVLFLHHDLDQEAPALAAALGSSAFCIGPLGATRPHRRRVERLRELGYDN